MIVFVKNLLRRPYQKLRKALGGHGLSHFPLLRETNFLIEKLLSEKPKEFILIKGERFYLDKEQTYKPEDYDNIEAVVFRHFLKAGDIFVDVGAHIGWFSRMAEKIVGEEGRVFAFEPNPDAREILKKNVQGTIIEPLAVSNVSGAGTLYTLNNKWHGSTLLDPASDRAFWVLPHVSRFKKTKIHHREVRVVALDDYFGDRRVDFVKIDTEGNDGQVLLGMRNILKRNPNIVVYMEYAPSLLAKYKTDPEELVEDIMRQGYHLYMTDGKILKSWIPVNHFSGNIIFTKRSLSLPVRD